MASSAKKKLDEKHLKMLRDMVALVHNRECFDCHQRGPTYVNMTIGSFVCTACSGLLRGLNPPHRVKSMSMSSFTPEEMEFIVCRGNDFCRRTWTGLHDGKSHAELSSKDEGKMRDFLAQKYEKKRWYVAPTEAMLEEAKRMNVPEHVETKPLKSLSTGVAALTLQNGQSKNTKAQTVPDNSVSRPAAQPVSVKPFIQPQQPVLASSPPKAQVVPKSATFDLFSSPATSSVPKSATVDLLADFGSDPFGTAPANAAPHSPTGVGFGADFSQFGSSQQPQFNSNQQAPNVFQSSGGLLQPQTKGAGNANNLPVAHPPPPPANTDKYSALADLDGLFSSSAASSSQGGTGVFGGGAANNVFGGNNSGGNIFGGGTSSNIFGSSTSGGAFGGNTAGSSGIYGGNATSGSMFSGSAGGGNIFGSSAVGANTLGGSGGNVHSTWAASQPTNSSSWGAGGQPVPGGWPGNGASWGGATQPVSVPQSASWGASSTQWSATGASTSPQQWAGAQYPQSLGAPAAAGSMNPFLSMGPTSAAPLSNPTGQFGVPAYSGVPNGFMGGPQQPTFAGSQWGPINQPAAFSGSWAMQSSAGTSQAVRQTGQPKVASTNPFL